mmetsp:Transcript_23826/g.38239  ORF Transcript_23826/g.38239 Transcript_23826/m.38239 type:complete len:96 (+) Transcript_23826:55-342(+)
MAEEKKAYDEFTIECTDVDLDQKVITSDDIKKLQFSTSYTKGTLQKPGSLLAANFVFDKNDKSKLLSFTLQVVQPAKDNDGAIDPQNEYAATIKY